MLFSRQCVLEKRIPGGMLVQVSWIPEQYAIKDKFLFLKDEEEGCRDGWQVVSVGGRQSREERIERSRDHVRQRKASDI